MPDETSGVVAVLAVITLWVLAIIGAASVVGWVALRLLP